MDASAEVPDGLRHRNDAAAQVEPEVPEKAVGTKADQGSSATSSYKDQMISYSGPGFFGLVMILFLIIGAAKGSDAVCLLVMVFLIFLVFGELIYSRFLANYIFSLSDDEVTPASEPGHEDDPDFCATPCYLLWGHHWTSITGAAPIVGPAMAAYYGWLPGMLWIVFGCLFSGAVHDMGTLVVSARNGGRSIADLSGYLVSWRLRIIFLLINFLCMLVVAKFMELIAKLFILWPQTVLPVNAEIPLAVIMGLVNRAVTQKFGSQKAKIVVMTMSMGFLILLYGLVFAAVKIEEDSGEWVGGKLVNPVFGFKIGEGGDLCRDSVNYNRGNAKLGTEDEYNCGFGAMQFWTFLLCAYAMVAACIPVWVLLQPRDFLNSHQLKVVMAALLLALVIKGPKLDADAIRQDRGTVEDREPIFPNMFTLIACGATSGFHGLVSTGVTSKQLNKMRDARVVGYTAMMGESCLSALVMVVVCSAGTWKTVYAKSMNWTGFLAAGGTLLEELGIDPDPAFSIMCVLVVSFAATTLDSGMRIQRILVGELGKSVEKVSPMGGRLFSNIIFQIVVSAVPSLYIANSRSINAVWSLFGATNQLTACVSLLVVAVYVLRFKKYDLKYVLPFVLPILWLLIMISWALIRVIRFYLLDCDEKGCDWYSTNPIWPTVILSIIIAALVFATYLEIAYYFVSGKYKHDEPISETGKLDICAPCGPGSTIPSLGCC
ncbi:unnamed protein product [Polarella glacialis]|uniref:CstA N-terminal domain-containing protein n=1 Tax=Polarella glacialis TaxID=89957 RepID=A0A813LP81_POLGL|nr:unnamed protein product [Polarella glacialis]